MKTKKYTDKELAEAHIFPSQLSPTEKKETEKEFSEFRKNQTFDGINIERINIVHGNLAIIDNNKVLYYLIPGELIQILKNVKFNVKEMKHKWISPKK